jgi:hypothetical protein
VQRGPLVRVVVAAVDIGACLEEGHHRGRVAIFRSLQERPFGLEERPLEGSRRLRLILSLSRRVSFHPCSTMALFARGSIVFSCSLATFEAELDVLGKEAT